MDKRAMNLIWGALIVLFGVLLLLVTTEIIDINVDSAWIFGIFFLFVFLIFMGVYFSMHRKEFWPLIPGIISLGLCLLILSNKLNLSGNEGAAIFMLSIGLSFLVVYLFHHEHWWAIIPAGMVASVALVIYFSGTTGVGLMFLGMGLTFLVLYFVLLTQPEKHWWPLIPGGILAFMGMLFLFFEPMGFGQFVLPVALIIVGIILIANFWKEKKPEPKQ